MESAKILLNSTTNPIEAAKKANIDVSFIEKLKGYLNTPTYSLLLPILGIDKQTALSKLESLENILSKDRTTINSNGFNQSSSNSQVDDLEKFKRGISSFK